MFTLLGFASNAQELSTAQLSTSPITMPLTAVYNLGYINGFQYYAPTYVAELTKYGVQLSDDRPNLFSGFYVKGINFLDALSTGFTIEFTYDIAGDGYNGKYGMGFVMSLFGESNIAVTTLGAPDGALGYAPKKYASYLASSSTNSYIVMQSNSLGFQKGFLGLGFDLSGEFKNFNSVSDNPTQMRTGIPRNQQPANFLNSTTTITLRGGVDTFAGAIAAFPVYSSVATELSSNNILTLSGVGSNTTGTRYTYGLSTQSFSAFDIKGGAINPYPGTSQFRRAKMTYYPGTAVNTFYYTVEILVGSTWERVMPWTFVPATVNIYDISGTYGNNLTIATPSVSTPTYPFNMSFPLRIGFTATTGSDSGAQIYVRDLSITSPFAPLVTDYIIDNVSLSGAGSSYSLDISGMQGYQSSRGTITGGTAAGSTITDPALSETFVNYNQVRLLTLDESTSTSTPVGTTYTTTAGTFSYDPTSKSITFTASEGISRVSTVAIGYDILGTNGVRSRTGKIILNVIDNGYVLEEDIVDFVKING